jgi:cytochrome c oxidase subunit 1
MGGIAGLIQANVGLNMIFHNTQWVVALHAHTFLLTGVGTMLFSVIYTLVPMLTGLEFKFKKLVDWHLWMWLIGSVSMAYAMGMAGSEGMLRRTLYTGGEFTINTLVAFIGGTIAGIGFVLFLVNLVSTVGMKTVWSLVLPDGKGQKPEPVTNVAE